MADKDLNHGDMVWVKLYYDKTESLDMSGNHVVSVRAAHPDSVPRALGCLHVRLSNVSPVADPAPPAGLLAAAREYISAHDSQMETYERRDNSGPGLTAVIEASQRLETALDALRREVEAAAESTPVALTDDEKRHVANRAIMLTFRGYGPEKTSIDWCREIVDAFLSDLDELGFELRRRT